MSSNSKSKPRRKLATAKSKSTSGKPPSAGKKPAPGEQGPLSLWNRSVEYHRYVAEWFYFQSGEGLTETDLCDFAMNGDFVAQAYLCALRKAVHPVCERGIPVDYFERLLLAHIQRLNAVLCELAQEGRIEASHALWDQALKLTETFSELALKNPARFRSKARASLFMPSIRSRSQGFTADAKAIAEAIELSADSVGDKLTDNRVRLGGFCARLVAECVHEIKLARHAWADFYTRRKREVIWPTAPQVQPFLGMKTMDDVLQSKLPVPPYVAGSRKEMTSHLRFYCTLAGCGAGRLHFLILPELTAATASQWWKEAVEKLVEARFASLLEMPWWHNALKAASSGTKADMLKELKDYSREKVRQFV